MLLKYWNTWSTQPKYSSRVKPFSFFSEHRMDAPPSQFRFASPRRKLRDDAMCHSSLSSARTKHALSFETHTDKPDCYDVDMCLISTKLYCLQVFGASAAQTVYSSLPSHSFLTWLMLSSSASHPPYTFSDHYWSSIWMKSKSLGRFYWIFLLLWICLYVFQLCLDMHIAIEKAIFIYGYLSATHN